MQLDTALLDRVPITVLFVGITLLNYLAFEVGFRIGGVVRRRRRKEAPEGLGPMVAGLLGMLAFVLAFTFSMAAAQQAQRRQAIVNEANACGTAWLRADLLAEPHGPALKQLLKEYVDVRLAGARSRDIGGAIRRSLELHELCWAEAVAAARVRYDPPAALAIQAVNEVIDLHGTRVAAGLYNRIPTAVWITLFAISALSMAVLGSQAGLGGARRLVAVIPLLLAFSALATVVVALDGHADDIVIVSQQALADLQAAMERSMGKAAGDLLRPR